MANRLKSAGGLTTATAAVLFTVAGPAAATTGSTSTTKLSLTGFSSIVADSTRHEVFVSGAGSDAVEVTDFNGRPVTTLPALDGATSLAR